MTVELPAHWVYTSLSNVVEINPKLDKSQYKDDLEVSFVPMPSVEAETGNIDVSDTRQFASVKKGYTSFQEKDVIFAKITPCMENGKMAVVPKLVGEVGFGSTEFHVLRPYTGVDPIYIYYYVSSKSFRYAAEHNMTGAVGQRRVPTPYLECSSICLPPEAEQGRIVAKIEELFSELDKGVESLKLAREQLKVYRQAILKSALEGNLTGKSSAWKRKSIGELTELVTSGSRGWAKYYSDNGEIFIRAQNLKFDRLDLSDTAYVEIPDNAEGTRTRVQKNDLLITITGANVTKSGLIEHDLGAAYVSQHVALCRPTGEINPEFFYWFVVAEAAGRKQLNSFAYGAGKPGLNLQNIKDVQILLPSYEEQIAIVEAIEQKLSACESVESEIGRQFTATDCLRQSILKKAFSGKLVDQDASDESASVLLERIQSEKEDGKKKGNAA